MYETYHCDTPKLLNYAKIDTLACAVFYVRDKADMINSFLPKMEKYCQKEHALIQMYEKRPDISLIDPDQINSDDD